ncbi:hypothetical protein [Herbaspirillum rubrisubalbicans]|uniref:Uncharacterized protein n=1 Tax=Herbaspirillum rubrisubalbicans TaxID=80842 RepID=A0AAD0UC09_9BURK|nr:hypothetical protein [Herbaspirillum rubrisubalbicans]AYR25677.1 hypothetical protein RC54_18455 [Herbaspirillum rubrisubalbicans]
MNKRFGPSLYYASDKNIFDALTQQKVTIPTVTDLLLRRNVIVGRKTSKEVLATYFSRLSHDYVDHQAIAARLGIAARKERTTSMDVEGLDLEHLQQAIAALKTELEDGQDIVQITREDGRVLINIRYTRFDYRKSEFSQIQVRDGEIEFVKIGGVYRVRNTQSDYINNVRDTLLGKVDKLSDSPLKRSEVSLFSVPSPELRSKFFHELMNSLPGYIRKDVSEVYVYKKKPKISKGDSGSDSFVDADDDSSKDGDGDEGHVERVFLRGNGVTRSKILSDLLKERQYYIVKVVWTVLEQRGRGSVYEIEALFEDHESCSGFSFLLAGVYVLEESGAHSTKRRSALRDEVEIISKAIEAKSRLLKEALEEEYKKPRDESKKEGV